MITYADALARILDLARPGSVESCPAAEALGRILAEDVVSPDNLPPFDNSAMDGFALRTEGQVLAAGREFQVHGAVMAGDGTPVDLGQADQAWEIMTGARLPADADTVVPVEQVEILARDGQGQATRMRLLEAIELGRHVRRAGEDVARGAVVMAAGCRVGAPQLAMLAALGIGTVAVRRRPRVALVCTGRELVDAADAELAPGQIRNSNGPLLAARIRAAGAELVLQRTVSDTPEAFLAVLREAQAANVDVFVSTGAVSMGQCDFVPDALRQAGAEIHFHKVRIRPGKPLLFASLPNGTLCFGLPGNPASSAVGLRFFIEPALRALLGLAPQQPLRAVLDQDQKQLVGWRQFLKARLVLAEDGVLRAKVLSGQESFRIRPLLEANAWVAMPGDAEQAPAGSRVEAWLPGHLDGLQLELP